MLPQLDGRPMVTDGGLETDLIFHHGVDLPEFAAYPLVGTDEGRALLRAYYDGYAAIAGAAGAGLRLESPTWRANPDWGGGARLRRRRPGPASTARRSSSCRRWPQRRGATASPTSSWSGMVGPRGDGYAAGQRVDPDEAADYHRPQVARVRRRGRRPGRGADPDRPGRGDRRRARGRARSGSRSAISFTVETDGRLPDGTPLRTAIDRGRRATRRPAYFLVNCAHPQHVAAGARRTPGRGRERIAGLRSNASTLSHAELDEAEDLDEGDLGASSPRTARSSSALPALEVVGGCCGTDARHVAALWGVGDQADPLSSPT